MKTISRYELGQGDNIRVFTPYCGAVISQCRKWGGKFVNGAWEVKNTRLGAVQELIGKDQNDLVEVEVGREEWEDEYEPQLRIGWHVLASRRGRDSRPDIYANLVAGEIPSSGGSVKNPRVGPSADARFRLYVPRDFAEARNLLIVSEPDKEETYEAEIELNIGNSYLLPDHATNVSVQVFERDGEAIARIVFTNP